MADINHTFGSDVQLSSTFDLGVSSGITYSQQRIIRRILTPPDDYIYHNNYGIGAGTYVGASSSRLNELKSLIMKGLSQEPSVSFSEDPIVTLTTDANTLYCNITYIDADTDTTQILTFDTGGTQ